MRLGACKLDINFVTDGSVSATGIALVIVHEATHARLFRYGIGYEEWRRAEVEAVCTRRELAFATKAPEGQRFVSKILGHLAHLHVNPEDYRDKELREKREAFFKKTAMDIGMSSWQWRLIPLLAFSIKFLMLPVLLPQWCIDSVRRIAAGRKQCRRRERFEKALDSRLQSLPQELRLPRKRT